MKMGRRRHSLQEPNEKLKRITVGSLAIYKHRRNSGGIFVIAYRRMEGVQETDCNSPPSHLLHRTATKTSFLLPHLSS